MKTLPHPKGPYPVGSTTRTLWDSARPRHLLSQETGRRIFVKTWYPTSRVAFDTCRRELLWEQLDHEPNIPGFVKLLLRPAMKVLTHCYENAPYAPDGDAPLRTLFYSHGLISFASENTMLMEHFASHGYLVIALQHLDQLAELQSLGKALPENEKREQAKLKKRIKAASREKRAAAWKEYFRIATNTNRIVAARAEDIDYAVASLETVLEGIPAISRSAAPEPFGALGLSVGGAVATEYAKTGRTRVRCVVNLDGGIYGTQLEEPIDGNYLMLYSDANDGINDSALTATDGAEIQCRSIKGTKHLNFHDIAAMYPRLRWLGAIGRANPIAALDERNRIAQSFVSDVAEPRDG